MRNGSPVDSGSQARGGRQILPVLAAFLCSGAALASTTPVPPPAPIAVIHTDITRDSPEMRIVAFGSSSTEGVGASSVAMNYPSRLEQIFTDAYRGKLLVRVVNRGIGGEDIDDMMRRLRTDVLPRKPDLVIWQVGSNDALRGVALDSFKAELEQGIAAIRDTGAEVVLMEPQWSPQIDKADASSRFVDAVREVGATEHVDVVRRFDLMHRWIDEGRATRAELIGPDGLHMTDKGYDLLAHAVFDELSAHSARLRDRVAVATAKHP